MKAIPSRRARREGKRIIVTHADTPIGRRLIKSLHHDPKIERVLALGAGPPGPLDRFLNSPRGRLHYARIDLTDSRAMREFYCSADVMRMRFDTLLHVPAHGVARAETSQPSGGHSERIRETRLVLKHALDLPGLTNLIALGSAYVYRLAPGNSNRLGETSELDLGPKVPADIRSWIDCDMMFQSKLRNGNLRITLLRVPSVITSGGLVHMNPNFGSRLPVPIRPLGFDPICALVSDNDLANAVHLAIHGKADGIFNIAGKELVPVSILAAWTGDPTIPIPGGLMEVASRVAGLFGAHDLESSLAGAHLRYGFSLDTGRAARELGFEPEYRVGLARTGDGRLRLETAPA